MHIPFAKPFIGQEEEVLVRETIASGWIAQGPRVQDFEKLVATYTGAAHAVATISCTTALFTTLKLLDIGEEDEVIVPSLSFIASANAIVHVGARPVFCEVEQATYNLDVSLLSSFCTPRTKAIMAVHQLGIPCDLDPLYSLAKKHDLLVIEDAACALGSLYRGRQIGKSGIVCFSFHPRKVITTGEGGMILTSDAGFAERARVLRAHGMTADTFARHEAEELVIEEHHVLGYNFRMTDIQAAMGIAQMQKLPVILRERKRVVSLYQEYLGDIPWLQLPSVPSYADWNCQSYQVMLTADAPCSQKDCMVALLEKGITTRRGVMAIHLERYYRDTIGKVSLPVTENIAAQSVLLPLYPEMTEKEVVYVAEALRSLA